MKLTIDVKHKQYDIILEKGCLSNLSNYMDTTKKYFILTDTNIPDVWIDMIASQLCNCMVYKVNAGEDSKSIKTFEMVCNACLSYHMTRKDTLIALGGGVIGDLGGYVAASYMRGISFINIPTTTLSQIDSSIGGKVAINLHQVKNIIGAFYHPDLVLIDTNTLSTLPERQIVNGLVEALKEGLIYDPSLYDLFKKETYRDQIETIIYKSLLVKKEVVELDEKEANLRKILNFGHTIGHGIESYYHLETYYHGECVAMGMLYFIENEPLRKEVIQILKMMNIPYTATFDKAKVYDLIAMDKKAYDEYISVIKVEEVGKAYIEDIKQEDIKDILERNFI